MTEFERIGLEAKVNMANAYLGKLLKQNVKIHSTDIFQVVTRDMREHVTIIEPEVAKVQGIDIVRIKGVA